MGAGTGGLYTARFFSVREWRERAGSIAPRAAGRRRSRAVSRLRARPRVESRVTFHSRTEPSRATVQLVFLLRERDSLTLSGREVGVRRASVESCISIHSTCSAQIANLCDLYIFHEENARYRQIQTQPEPASRLCARGMQKRDRTISRRLSRGREARRCWERSSTAAHQKAHSQTTRTTSAAENSARSKLPKNKAGPDHVHDANVKCSSAQTESNRHVERPRGYLRPGECRPVPDLCDNPQ